MAAPLVWVTTELGRTHLFSGFPWVLLGYSQVTVLPIAQLASLFGVYGVSAFVVTVNAAAAHVALRATAPDGRPGASPEPDVAAWFVVRWSERSGCSQPSGSGAPGGSHAAS